MKACSIEGCEDQVCSGGLCQKHYHPLHQIWGSMKTRCYNENHKSYKNHGFRGITVCDEWRNDAKVFIEWALPLWKKGLTIDRRDNDGDYSSENCRFITMKENLHNQRLLRKTNTSGYRGVSRRGKYNKWCAQIMINGNLKYLGLFNSKKLAAIRYDVEAYLNDDRPRNFIH